MQEFIDNIFQIFNIYEQESKVLLNLYIRYAISFMYSYLKESYAPIHQKIEFNRFFEFATDYRFGPICSRLQQKGLGTSEYSEKQLKYLFEHFVKTKSADEIKTRILGTPAEKPLLTEVDFSEMEYEFNICKNILMNSVITQSIGTNILLYGPSGSGKVEFTKLLAETSNCTLLEIESLDNNGKQIENFRRLRILTQKLNIIKSFNKNSIIVFDNAKRPQMDEYLRHIYLDENCVPIIWITENEQTLDNYFVNKMTYCVKFTEFKESIKLNILKNELVSNNLRIPPLKVLEICNKHNLQLSSMKKNIQSTKLSNGDEITLENITLSKLTALEDIKYKHPRS